MLSVGPAFLVLFSEKVSADGLVDVRRVDADIDPELAAGRFDNMDVCTM